MIGTQKLAALSSSRPVVSRCLLGAARQLDNNNNNNNKRCFHASPSRSVFRAAWMPMRHMRVKTPWVDALAQSREQQAASDGAKSDGTEETPAKPDLTPKRMSDSYFSGVRNFCFFVVCEAANEIDRFFLWLRISGCWIPISMLRAVFGMYALKRGIIDAEQTIDWERFSWISMPWLV